MSSSDDPGGDEPRQDAPPEPTRADGPPHPTRNGRRQERRARRAAFRRYLGLTVLGAVLPGSAFIARGRRWLGLLILGVVLLALAVIVTVLFRDGPRTLGLELALNPQELRWLGIGMLLVAGLWVLLMIGSQRVLEPRSLSVGQRLTGAALVIVLCSVVAAPLAVGSQYAFTQRDLVSTIFPDIPIADDPGSITKPRHVTVEDPWAGQPRVNILMIGGDHTSKREGTRTDTNIVASVDTRTGQTVLFSLPRNLQKVPFPPGPFRRAYPHGFTRPGQSDVYLLNAIYDTVPAEHPELFPKGVRDPGVEALKLAVGQVLGLKIDYYVMVNISGFRSAIDALGGVYVNVRERIPMNSKSDSYGGCTKPDGWIEPGEHKLLNGNQAMWFARARCGGGELSDADNARIRRQRCMVGAIIDRASPQTLLLHFKAIAGAARQLVTTDIPQQLLPAFLELGQKVTQHPVKSLPFTGTTLKQKNSNPDFAQIRRLVHNAITAPPAPATPSSGTKPKPSTSPSRHKGELTGKAVPLNEVC